MWFCDAAIQALLRQQSSLSFSAKSDPLSSSGRYWYSCSVWSENGNCDFSPWVQDREYFSTCSSEWQRVSIRTCSLCCYSSLSARSLQDNSFSQIINLSVTSFPYSKEDVRATEKDKVVGWFFFFFVALGISVLLDYSSEFQKSLGMWSPRKFKVFSTGRCGIYLTIPFLFIWFFFFLLTREELVYSLSLKPGIYSWLFSQTYSGPFQSNHRTFCLSQICDQFPEFRSFIYEMMPQKQ